MSLLKNMNAESARLGAFLSFFLRVLRIFSSGPLSVFFGRPTARAIFDFGFQIQLEHDGDDLNLVYHRQAVLAVLRCVSTAIPSAPHCKRDFDTVGIAV